MFYDTEPTKKRTHLVTLASNYGDVSTTLPVFPEL